MMKILIVEDNPKARAMIKRLLLREFEQLEKVVECEDGQAAIDIYPDFQPDWVLMDINLPVLDGLQAAERICQTYQDARIIMVTTYDDVEYRDAASKAGACAYVLKEDLEQLTGIIR